MRRTLILLLLIGLVFVATVSAAAAPTDKADECTWGASSIVVEEVDGRLVQSVPETSGCIP